MSVELSNREYWYLKDVIDKTPSKTFDEGWDEIPHFIYVFSQLDGGSKNLDLPALPGCCRWLNEKV